MAETQHEAMVDVGGHRLFVVTQGAGSPNVIFESGGGDTEGSWRAVQSILAANVRTWAYARAGLGRSERPHSRQIFGEAGGVQYESSQSTIDDLLGLLRAAEADPPYVLVGHSLGGLFIRIFAHQNPDLVAGLVFVDSRPPEWNTVLSRIFRQSDAPSHFKDGALSGVGAVRHIYESAVGTGPFRDLPIAVLSADPKTFIRERVTNGVPRDIAIGIAAELAGSQSELAALSSDSTVRVVKEVGHGIQLEAPDQVAEAIMDVVRRARVTTPDHCPDCHKSQSPVESDPES